MEISIVIPTIRPDTIKKTIERINQTTKNISYEIVVVSPLDLDIVYLSNVKYIKETRKLTKHQAINLGVKKAEGKYVFHIPDYSLVNSNCIENLVRYMQQNDDKLIVVSPRWHTLWEVVRECWIWKDVYFAKTPCIKKDNLKLIGNEFYNTKFTSYYGDIDLSLRVLQANGIVEVCPNTFIEVYNPSEEENTTRNEKVFWEEHDLFISLWGNDERYIPEKQLELPSNAYNMNDNDKFVLPHEKCSRIFQLLKYNKLDELSKELDEDNYIVSKFLLVHLLCFILIFAEKVYDRKLKEKLIKCLLKHFNKAEWSSLSRQEFINRFTIRPQNEVSSKDIERLFGIYGDVRIFYFQDEKFKKKVLVLIDDLISYRYFQGENVEEMYKQIMKGLEC